MSYPVLSPLDVATIQAVNWMVGRSELFDRAVACLPGNALPSALLVAVFWAYWFRDGDGPGQRRTREHVLATFAAALIGIVAARVLAALLPFRLRPRFEPTLVVHTPAASDGNAFVDWSSFPSDNAVMFFALAVGLYFISRRAGVLAMLYVVVVICLPRIYLGYHYASDVIGGLVIGACMALLCNVVFVRRTVTMPALHWAKSSPQSFYALMFLLTFQFSTLFSSVNWLALGAFHHARHLLASS